MGKWPRDNQADLLAFYGTPGPEVERQLVPVLPPFRMTYSGQGVRQIRFHAKAAPALRRTLDKIWDYYGRDQAVLDALCVSHYDGAYNPRKVRGSDTKWSNHAFGAAIDLDATHNGFNTGHGHMPLPVVAAFKSEGARWGGDYAHRTDAMHFEWCDSGEPARTFEQWLAVYHCPPKYDTGNHPTVKVDPAVQPKDPVREPAPVPPPPDVEPIEPPVAKPTQPDAPAPEPREERKSGFGRRAMNWISSVGATIGGFAFDWRLGVLLVFVIFCAVAFLLWLFGKEPIKAWISRHFGGGA